MPVAPPNLPAPDRPQSGHRAQWGALPRAGRAGDEDGVARPRRELDVAAQRPAIRQIEIERIDGEAAAAAVDRDRLCRTAVGGDLLDPAVKAAQPLDDRLVFGDLGVARHNERKRILHLAEGRGDLHQPAELDLLCEIARRRDDKREDDRQLLLAAGEPGELLASTNDVPPIQHAVRKTVLEYAVFAALAAIKRDALGMLAQAHQAEAEIRLIALLVEQKRHQRIADLLGQPRAPHRVDDRGDDHVAGNIEAAIAAQWDVQRARQRPQDEQEREQRYDRIQQAERQREAGRGEAVEIVRDALVRIVGRGLIELHPVIGLVAQPILQVALGHPAPPADLQDLPQILLIDRDDDQGGRDHPEDRELPPEFWPVIFLEGVVEIVVPRIEADIEPNRGQVERDHGSEQEPRRPALLAHPERPGELPGRSEKSALRHTYSPP